MKIRDLIYLLISSKNQLDMHIAYDVWFPCEIDTLAKDKDIILTEQEINTVLEYAQNKHNIEEGLTIMLINDMIDDVVNERNLP